MKEELKKATDYSEGQKTAAYMVLGEIVNLLNEFSDNIRIIGGWVPTLLYPAGDHIGSIDVDVLLNQLEIKKAESYRTIKRILTQNGYRRHEEKYFTFIKTIVLDGVSYDVDVDFLSGKYGGGVFCNLPDGAVVMCRYSFHYEDSDFKTGDTVMVVIQRYDDGKKQIFGKIVGR
jgi:hypothetical protein